MTSKAYFMVTGYMIYMTLARLLGPELFGIYSIVIGLISTISMVLITSINQATSKYVSEQNILASSIKKSSLKLQFILGTTIFISFLGLSNFVAALFNDQNLAYYFRLAAPIILFYSFYGVFLGYVNGLKQFKKQALLEILYSTFKVSLILLLVVLGYSLLGALVGFVGATLLIFLISILLFGVKGDHRNFPMGKLFKFQIPIMAYTLLINLLLNIDLFLIKALSEPDVSNLYAGFYTAALTIARISYMAIIPISYVIFPFISESSYKKDKTKTKIYITNCLRFCAMFLALVAILLSTNAHEVITLLYSDAYSSAAVPLSIVCFGLIFLSLITISTSIISADGLPKNSFKIVAGVFAIDFVLNYLLIPKYNLTGAAVATTISMGLGATICLIYLKKRFDAFLPLSSLLKVIAASGIVYFLSYFIKLEGILLIAKLSLLSGFFLGIILLSKEIIFIPKFPFLTLNE